MNILRVFYTDPTLDRCAAAHEWLSSSDLYRSHATNGMNGYALEALHIPAAAAAVHLLCRVEQRPDLTFSTRELADSQYLMESNDLLVKKFVEGTSLQAHCTRNSSQVAIDTVPYALWVLSAGEGSSALNRAVTSIDLLSNGERRAFDHHTASIRSLGLSYVPDNDDALNEKGYSVQAVEHKLDPPIERLTKFALPNHRQSIPPAVSYI